ncbi:hypothetical protein GCM10028895_36400 [Pontibacter rugosus]
MFPVLGLSAPKYKGETSGMWELEDERKLEKIAWLKMQKTEAIEV